MIFEVDVEPLAPGGPCLGYCYFYEPRAGSSSRRPRADHSVYDEGVYSAVPDDVYEPDQSLAVVGARPAEAVLLNLAFPVLVEELMVKSLCVQGVECVVVEVAPPLEPVCAHEGVWLAEVVYLAELGSQIVEVRLCV